MNSLPIATLIALVTTLALAPPPARADLQAGAAAIDVTPPGDILPVFVNGGMTSRSVAKIKTTVNARAIGVR